MLLKKLLNFSGYQQARKIIIAAGTSSMSKYNVVFVLGGPGAGKGTQCQNIVKVICQFMTFLRHLGLNGKFLCLEH